MAGLTKWFSNDSKVHSHTMRDPEARTSSCLSMTSPLAGLFSLLLVHEQPSPAIEEDAARAVTCSKIGLSK